MMIRIALLLLLCSASLPLMAREVRHAGPNGDGPCPTAAEKDAAEVGAANGERSGTAPAAAERPATPGTTTDTSVRGPRWHSFLPGMFR